MTKALNTLGNIAWTVGVAVCLIGAWQGHNQQQEAIDALNKQHNIQRARLRQWEQFGADTIGIRLPAAEATDETPAERAVQEMDEADE